MKIKIHYSVVLQFIMILLMFAGCSTSPKIVVDIDYKETNHLQGIAADSNYIYWAFSKRLIKTDYDGNKLDSIVIYEDVLGFHFGDIAISNSKLFVATEENVLKWGEQSKIYIFNINNLASPINIIELEIPHPYTNHGAGAIAVLDGHYYVSGFFEENEEIKITEFNSDWEFIDQHKTEISNVKLGVQSMSNINGTLWIGCYEGDDNSLYIYDKTISEVGFNNFHTYYGVCQINNKDLFVGRTSKYGLTYVEKIAINKALKGI